MKDELRFDRSSRSKLTARDLDRFGGTTLFDRVGRAVCRAECLPRKELYEAWEVARRVRRRLRGGRVIDLACGHGLLAYLMLVLDDSSERALAVDVRIPESAAALAEAMAREWPRLAGRVSIERTSIDAINGAKRSDGRPTPAPFAGVGMPSRSGATHVIAVHEDDLIVSAHACGALTDAVLGRAIDARARVAVLPCCHDAKTCDSGGLEGWLDVPLAIDATRVARLRAAGYRVHTQLIPAAITPKNRLILAAPQRLSA